MDSARTALDTALVTLLTSLRMEIRCLLGKVGNELLSDEVIDNKNKELIEQRAFIHNEDDEISWEYTEDGDEYVTEDLKEFLSHIHKQGPIDKTVCYKVYREQIQSHSEVVLLNIILDYCGGDDYVNSPVDEFVEYIIAAYNFDIESKEDPLVKVAR
jgi:hypothetical protein